MSSYLINEHKIDENCKHVRDAFHDVPTKFAYSVKTNHVPTIIKRFHNNGFLTEVVSDMEVDFALFSGIPMSMIVYNGPRKGYKAKYVAEGGGVIVFDSINDFIAFADSNKPCRCMFRVAININNGVDTRFGIKPRDVKYAIARAKKLGFDVIGIHCHVTKGRSLESWAEKLSAMADIYSEVKDELSEKIVDMGGNMYSNMSDKMLDVFPDAVSYEEYASLFNSMKDMFDCATFMLEMGTSVVSDCVDFRASVLSIKKTDKNTYVLVDAVNYALGWAAKYFNYPCRVVNKSNVSYRVSDAKIVGRLCTEDDVMYRGFNGKVAAGDELIFSNVGSYSIVTKPPFIVPQYEIYATEDGVTERLVKRAESSNDLLGTYVGIGLLNE